jgi:hypothetical protein
MTMTLEIRPKNSQGAITTSLLLRELSVSEGEKTTYRDGNEARIFS